MIRELAPGRTLEIGAGIGAFRRYYKGSLVSTDILAVPDIETRCDAQRLPFREGSFDNILGVDFIHHLERPQAFLDEAARVLRPGGRVVAVEPYLSPFADFITRHFHHEADERHHEAGPKKDALTSDVRLPTDLFVKNPERLARTCPRLRLRTAQIHTTSLAYALSGGFTYRSFLPSVFVPLVDAFDRIATAPLRRFTAFKLLVALERV
jgi:SAM-dependent methyltransferase